MMLVSAHLCYMVGQKWRYAAVYEYEERSIGIGPEPSLLGCYIMCKKIFGHYRLEPVLLVLNHKILFP